MKIKAIIRSKKKVERVSISLVFTATCKTSTTSKRITQYVVIPEQAYVEYWDNNKGCHNTSKKMCPPKISIDATSIDSRIMDIISYVKTCYEQAHKGWIKDGWLKKTIEQYYKPQKEKQVKDEKPTHLMEYCNKFLGKANLRKDRKTNEYIDDSSIVKYKKCLSLLKEFLTSKRLRDISFIDIDMTFYNEFVDFMYKKYNFALNTAGSHIKEFKAMLSAAEEDGCVVPQVYHKFKVMTEEKDATYLTEEEQDFLYKMDFSIYDKEGIKTKLMEYKEKYPDMDIESYINTKIDRLKLEKLPLYRDALLVLCRSGQRISDLKKIRPTKGCKTISFHQEKTRKKIILPIHSIIHQIFQRHNYDLEFKFSDQEFNNYIKIVCMLGGIDSCFEQKMTIGGKKVIHSMPKFMHITSHCGRRSFCTNEYMKKGEQSLPISLIMSVSGHTTESSFRKYIKATNEDFAQRVIETWEKHYGEIDSISLF